jgi:hypothetical protein
MRHVLWIGGTPGAGKTTIARALARRNGLRLYSADTQTWVHRDRALAAGHPGAVRWEAMSIEERRRIPPEDIFELWIHWERGAMLVDDVRALPSRPAVVAEGTTVPTDQRPALWLDRPSVSGPFAEGIRGEARRHDVPVLIVGGSIEETIAAVEGHFAAALTAWPRAETPDERRELLREANDALVFQVRTGTARPWATGTPQTVTLDFICECDDQECQAVLTIPVAEFERASSDGPVVAHAD